MADEQYQTLRSVSDHHIFVVCRDGTFYELVPDDVVVAIVADRIDEPEKNWKFSVADIEERKFWKQYMRAYEKCLTATSTRRAPWYIVPADDKLNTRLIVSRIVLDTVEGLKLSYPMPTAARRRELLSLRKKLVK